LAVGPGQRATFLHVSNLHRNQRTLRMIKSLQRHEVASTIGTSITAPPSTASVDYQLIDLSH
jgi:hypothetical protein